MCVCEWERERERGLKCVFLLEMQCIVRKLFFAKIFPFLWKRFAALIDICLLLGQFNKSSKLVERFFTVMQVINNFAFKNNLVLSDDCKNWSISILKVKYCQRKCNLQVEAFYWTDSEVFLSVGKRWPENLFHHLSFKMKKELVNTLSSSIFFFDELPQKAILTTVKW